MKHRVETCIDPRGGGWNLEAKQGKKVRKQTCVSCVNLFVRGRGRAYRPRSEYDAGLLRGCVTAAGGVDGSRRWPYVGHRHHELRRVDGERFPHGAREELRRVDG